MYHQNSFVVDGEIIPYYHFLYEENLHVLLRRKKYWKARSNKLDDGSSLISFLMEETFSQFDSNADFPVFERAVMLIIHYFSDNRRHDLDNFVYKPIVDCIRKTRIIRDDDYSNLSIFSVGQQDIKDCIEVFLVPFAYFVDFANQHFYELTDFYTSESEFKTIKQVEEETKKQKKIDMNKDESIRRYFELKK